MASVIYKNAAGRERLENWYDRFLAKVPGSISRQTVSTRHGDSHVLVAGRETGPPLVCLHAMRTGSAFLVSELAPLLSTFRVIAPDLPGQSVHGLDQRLSLRDDSHAQWLEDVLDAFSLDRIHLFGVSWGGFVARSFASFAPNRIERMGLMVPAGIANGSHWVGLMKMAWPMIRYRFRPNEQNLRQVLDPILTTWDADWAGFIECSMNDMKMDPRIPPLASDEELARLAMPVLVLAGDQDISFPGEAIANRLHGLVPQVDMEIMANCKHCPPTTPEFQDWLANRLGHFFRDVAG